MPPGKPHLDGQTESNASPRHERGPATRPVVRLWITGLATVFVLSCLALVVLLRSQRRVDLTSQAALDDPQIRELVIRELVRQTSGAFDSHPDASVARVLIANVQKRRRGDVSADTNGIGLRERDFALPKPNGTLRIVLLGDAYVSGEGVEPNERAGVFLERLLAAQAAAPSAELEVLHIGVPGWNILAECSFLRRQLTLLAPDLVIQIVVNDDLDDVEGVRGFGATAEFTPAARRHADALVKLWNPRHQMKLPGTTTNFLTAGHDSFSRERFHRANEAIVRLAGAVEERGGRYLLVARWDGQLAEQALGWLAAGLRPEQRGFLRRSFVADSSTWITDVDSFWNRTGMQTLAEALFHWIQSEDVLPALALKPATDLRARSRSILVAGEKLAVVEPRANRLGTGFDFERLDPDDGFHFYGGVDRRGLVAPWAAFSFRVLAGGTLVLRGSGLGRPELDGVTVHVRCDGEELGSFQVPASGTFEQRFALGDATDEFVSIELEGEDWVLTGDDLRDCGVFRLASMEIVAG